MIIHILNLLIQFKFLLFLPLNYNIVTILHFLFILIIIHIYKLKEIYVLIIFRLITAFSRIIFYIKFLNDIISQNFNIDAIMFILIWNITVL
jgi:hypothetical protein